MVTTSQGPARERARAWCERRGVVVSVALALAARLPALGSAQLGLDETWTWYLTEEVLRTGDFRRALALGGVDAPLFAAINVLVAKMAGLSVLGLRAPQAMFGTASVAIVFLLVRRLRDARLALPVALLAAWSPYLVFYSREARPYAQVLFFSLIFIWAFETTRHLRPVARRLLLTGGTALALTSHYGALVSLAAFHLLTLARHHLAGRREALRDDLTTAGVTLLAAAPLLFPLLFGLGRLPVPFWQVSDVSLPGILVEQFLFLGTTLPRGSEVATVLNLSVFALLLWPFANALWRRSGLIAAEPVLSCLWWLAPALVAAVGALIGQDLLFLPRGFISTAPFLLAYWVLFTSTMSGPRWARRAYVTLLLVPFVLSGHLVATSHPGQAYLRGRDSLAEVVRQVAVYRDEFDVILVDHWWIAPYFSYYYAEPSRVWALGRDDAERDVLADLERVPPDARVLLVLNELATSQTDPDGKVAAALAARRVLIRELPCSHDGLPGRGLVCKRMLLFGRAHPPGRAAP